MPHKVAKATLARKAKIKSKPKLKRTRTSSKLVVTNNANRLANLLNTISNNRSILTKSEINLPARLMQNGNKLSKPLEYSKSISSTFTSSIHNGEVHAAGKEVINDSTKPFIQLTELHNGQIEHYMIPRKPTSITRLNIHTSPSKTVTPKTKKTKKTKKTSKS